MTTSQADQSSPMPQVANVPIRPRTSPAGLSQREKDILELPVDRGWAWAVCFSGFATYMVLGLGTTSTVVMFMDIREHYDTNIPTALRIFTVFILTLSFTSIISTALITPKLGEKAVVAAGGCVFSLGSVLYSCAPTIWVFIGCSYIKGLGAGLAFVPGINLIRHYFHKRRFLATTIACTGTSVAVIAFQPMISALRDVYGLKGTFLIVAGLEMHMIAAALLMRPIKFYKYRPELPPLTKKLGAFTKDKETGPQKLKNEDDNIELREIPQGRQNGHTTDMEGRNNHEEELKQVLLTDSETGETGHTKVEEDGAGNSAEDRMEEIRRYASAHSLVSEPGPVTVPDGISTTDVKGKSRMDVTIGMWNNSIFGLWSFLLVLLSTVPCAAYLYIQTYVPTIAASQGATRDQEALLLTVIWSVDLVSRLLVGLFADTHILKPSQILIIAQMCLGILCQFLRFFTTFDTLIMMAVGIGLFIGTRLVITPMMCVEVVGVERMPRALCINALVATLSEEAFVNHLFEKARGDFTTVLHIIGVGLIIGSLLLAPLPFFIKMDVRRGRRRP